MFIDTLEKRFPKRVISRIEIGNIGFTILFDVARGRRLIVTFHMYEKADESFEVSETFIYSTTYRIYEQKVETYSFPKEVDPSTMLLEFFQIALGDPLVQTYGEGFEYLVLKRLTEKEKQSDE